MNNLNANIIKAIFPGEFINNTSLNNDIVEKSYKTDNIYLNSFQVPDQLANINGCHGLSNHIRNIMDPVTKQISNSDNDYTTPLIKVTEIDSKSLEDINISYHKLIMGKDIDWENAYLRYAPISYENVNQPITYFDIDPDTGNKINEGINNSYLYYSNIPTYINNTYDLFTIIDYLLQKLQALQFIFEKVKSQRSNMEIYKLKQQADNNS